MLEMVAPALLSLQWLLMDLSIGTPHSEYSILEVPGTQFWHPWPFVS